MKQPAKFVVGNVIKNAELSRKLGEAHREGYRIFSTTMPKGAHPGIIVVAMEPDSIHPPGAWVARYASKTKTGKRK